MENKPTQSTNKIASEGSVAVLFIAIALFLLSLIGKCMDIDEQGESIILFLGSYALTIIVYTIPYCVFPILIRIGMKKPCTTGGAVMGAIINAITIWIATTFVFINTYTIQTDLGLAFIFCVVNYIILKKPQSAKETSNGDSVYSYAEQPPATPLKQSNPATTNHPVKSPVEAAETQAAPAETPVKVTETPKPDDAGAEVPNPENEEESVNNILLPSEKGQGNNGKSISKKLIIALSCICAALTITVIMLSVTAYNYHSDDTGEIERILSEIENTPVILDGNMERVSEIRAELERLGGDTQKFDTIVLSKVQNAFKNTIDPEGDSVKQETYKDYLLQNGYTEERISSELISTSEMALKFQEAIRNNDEEAATTYLTHLIIAGITREDAEKLYNNSFQ